MIYLKLFYEFFKIGLFTFGGGYAMIPLVRDTAINSGWLLADEFSSLIAVCESTPGPVAINMATYIGSLQGGILGSACATLGVVLPSFIIILLIASLLNKLTENKHFKNFIRGVKPVVTALILSTGLLLLVECIGINIDVKEFDVNLVSIIVFGIVAVLYYIVLKVFKKKISSIQIILLAAVLGIGLSYLLA
jgi:chromate transporter